MEKKRKIDTLLSSKGFTDYKWIDANDIIVAQWVRVKCKFGCSDYGLGTCPPNTPSVKECKEFFMEYKNAVIIRLTKIADKNSYPSDWSREITKKLLDIERQTFLLGYHKAFLLNQTCCSLCKECTGSRLDCKDKLKSRPSPEAFAVDVYQTVRNCGMQIDVIKENPAKMNRIAILLTE